MLLRLGEMVAVCHPDRRPLRQWWLDWQAFPSGGSELLRDPVALVGLLGYIIQYEVLF